MANEIIHFGAVTLRVVGEGNLDMSLSGFDDIESTQLNPLAMISTMKREPTKLANFNVQRAYLRGSVDTIDEWFKINNITIWVKPIWTQYPE